MWVFRHPITPYGDAALAAVGTGKEGRIEFARGHLLNGRGVQDLQWDINDVIRFLREREIVHFQRFGEAIEILREKLDRKNVYFMNPAIDM